MKTQFNRIAIIPFHCTDCHRYIWLEKYRKAEVWTNLPPSCPSSIKKKICKDCLAKYDIGRSRDHQIKYEITDKIRAIADEWKSDTWTDNYSYECMVKIAELFESQESEVEE